jgi:DNA-binding NarL/FixJ family response regulator
VLIVDDHPLFRLGLSRVLAGEAGIRDCAEASGTLEALALLESGGPAPDLLVVDVVLDGPCGLELVRRTRCRRPELPILVCSMHDEELYGERSLAAGAHGYVDKKEPVEELLTAVHTVMAGERYLSPRLRGRSDPVDGPGIAPLARLSDRELEIYSLIGRGFSTRKIAERLELSIKTVESYREKIKSKLDLEGTEALARSAVAWFLAVG